MTTQTEPLEETVKTYDYDATYSPDDNKLRLYSVHRLDAETYARVKAAGFKWAPQQKLFVAPMWTPDREDLLIELAGEIRDEDTSLVDRAEERADRFEDYSDNRAKDAERAREAVSAIADNIPLGQPILVGHHSEKHARRDAEKIENGMRRAVKMWETSQYWKDRAAGALAHAKYKEIPEVRARRIKGIETDQRRTQKEKEQAEMLLKLWTKEGLTVEQALLFAGHTRAGNLMLPRKDGDKPDFNQRPSAYSALSNSYPSLYAPRTLEEIIEVAKRAYPRQIAYCERWLTHYENRLTYEKAMLEEQGASQLLEKRPRPKQLPLLNYRQAIFQVPNRYNRGEMMTYPQIEMTQEEYAKINRDYKGTRFIDNSHRIRTAVRNHALHAVFLTDAKVHEKPAPVEVAPKVAPEPRQVAPKSYVPPARTAFDDMKDQLKTGIQIVTAPDLFPTPPAIADRMVELLDVQDNQSVLEPSAGTGNLIAALARRHALNHLRPVHAVEINAKIAGKLQAAFPDIEVHAWDFLERGRELGTFDRILMNPPFSNAQDVKHILLARQLLNPGGLLVALCANGPRQAEALKPLAETWEELPENSFKEAGTGVRVVLLTMRN